MPRELLTYASFLPYLQAKWPSTPSPSPIRFCRCPSETIAGRETRAYLHGAVNRLRPSDRGVHSIRLPPVRGSRPGEEGLGKCGVIQLVDAGDFDELRPVHGKAPRV
jgi:hypothetical protein